jgi:predicted transcriptional regulator
MCILRKEQEPMEDKTTYTIEELYDELPMTLTDLGEKADLNEVTLARIRDGRPARRSTINRLLRTLSEIYGRPLSLRNVTGINVQVNKRVEKREARKEANAA